MSRMTSQLIDDFEKVRKQLIGYNDAALTATKARMAEEMGVDEGDMDAVLAQNYRLERCTACGHWFDQGDCDNDDGRGGFECQTCANE